MDCFDGFADILEERIQRARKPHTCDACSGVIQPGQCYSITASLYDGRWDRVKRCGRCELIYRRLVAEHRRRVHCWDEGINPRLDCGHSWREIFDEDPPDDVAALAFLSDDDAQAKLSCG